MSSTEHNFGSDASSAGSTASSVSTSAAATAARLSALAGRSSTRTSSTATSPRRGSWKEKRSAAQAAKKEKQAAKKEKRASVALHKNVRSREIGQAQADSVASAYWSAVNMRRASTNPAPPGGPAGIFSPNVKKRPVDQRRAAKRARDHNATVIYVGVFEQANYTAASVRHQLAMTLSFGRKSSALERKALNDIDIDGKEAYAATSRRLQKFELIDPKSLSKGWPHCVPAKVRACCCSATTVSLTQSIDPRSCRIATYPLSSLFSHFSSPQVIWSLRDQLFSQLKNGSVQAVDGKTLALLDSGGSRGSADIGGSNGLGWSKEGCDPTRMVFFVKGERVWVAWTTALMTTQKAKKMLEACAEALTQARATACNKKIALGGAAGAAAAAAVAAPPRRRKVKQHKSGADEALSKLTHGAEEAMEAAAKMATDAASLAFGTERLTREQLRAAVIDVIEQYDTPDFETKAEKSERIERETAVCMCFYYYFILSYGMTEYYANIMLY